MTAHKAMAKLAKFEAIELESANERFQLEEADDVFNIALEDIFGESPEHVFVHDGSLKIAGDVAVGSGNKFAGDYVGVYVIDGDLDVGGTLDFVQIDGGCVLYVTGSLRAKNIAVDQEAQLWVGKDLVADELIVASVSDAGGLSVKGSGTAKALIATDSETIHFGKKLKGRVVVRSEDVQLDEDTFKKIELAERALAKPFNTDEVDHDALVKAIKKGQQILA